MATRQIAQGLAGLGRYGDSMLMHVSPEEVAGLQELGKMHGASLTTNPHTGLPEAFSFGKFFKSLVPTIAGLGASALSGGTINPILAGAATGAGIAAASGDDILGGGLMGALGGYGGGNLASGLQGMSTTGANVAGTTGAVAPSASIAQGGAGSFAPTVATSGAAPYAGGAENIFNTAVQDTIPFSTTSQEQLLQNAAAKVPTSGPTLEGMAQGLGNIGKDGAFDAFKAGMGPNTTNLQAGMTIGMPALGAYSAGMTPEPYEEDPYDPNATLNLGGDTGLRLFAMGGSTNTYGNPDGTAAQNTLNENYGIGRLDRLAQASADSSASQYQFAGGGNVTVNLSTPSGLTQPSGVGPNNVFTPGANARGMMDYINPGSVEPDSGYMSLMDHIMAANQDPNGASHPLFSRSGGERVDLDSPSGLSLAKGGLADGGFVVPADVVSHLGNGSTDAGLQHLKNRMGARPIRGAGDGMSDSIKTTIEGKQPARIANGEAYIPPETVKQRGGAKNLYAMMDKVRKERTGTKKQGKQINPNKYLPA